MTKVVALLSGGLDSTLAVRVIQEQGIEVIGINFITPFFSSAKAERAAEKLNIDLRVIDISEEHLEVVKNPKHGYGKNMNPCVDCHALMVKKAGEVMKKEKAQVVITGEVLGERPKSQNRQALGVVERDAGLEGYVLRPLSAKHLLETKPELEGIIDREKLLDIKGRSRKPQFSLAKKYGINDFPTPAGGCLLTEKVFSKRLRDLFDNQTDLTLKDLELLKYGRHFRLTKNVKVIVGRDEKDNEALAELIQKDDLEFQVKDHPGPRAILKGKSANGVIEQAALLTARYSKARDLSKVEVKYGKLDDGEEKIIEVKEPMKTFQAEADSFRERDISS